MLGVEVDSIGNWKDASTVAQADITTYLNHLHDLGVRHLFPVHMANYEQKAAYLVKNGQTPDSSDSQTTQTLYPKVLAIWQRWQAMQGSNTPLTRSYAGQRDFDINIDGVAHYGMLPDFLQDLKNTGLTDADLAPFFRSAEDYLQMWAKCETRSQSL